VFVLFFKVVWEGSQSLGNCNLDLTILNPMQDRESEFWPRQLLKKWLSFQETGDDFERDSDPNAEVFSESEDFDDSDGIEGSGDDDTRELTESDPDTDAISTADSDTSQLLRFQSGCLNDQFVVKNEYKIAVGTWNVGGLLPSDDINLDGFLDASNPADIYVLGFQEIVPLNTNNVLCVEDDAPTVMWDGLIRHALNNRVNSCEEGESEEACSPSPPVWPEKEVTSLEKEEKSSQKTEDVKTAEEWLNMREEEGGVTDKSPLLETSSLSLGKHSSGGKYCRIASKQMVGVFISVWVRSELRRHVHNVKVSVVGCGILNFLRNKGAVSVSMSLHQTSFCFVCTHLTSGHKEGDEIRRNTDVADVLRRTTFPRVVKLSDSKMPETIMAHDRIIWLGDLNYRIDLPDKETWILVNQSDWKSLLPKDQLRTEREAGRVFKGWHESEIYFPPTYKFVVESDQYFGEDTFKGDKRRTPAWCDRILSHGTGLRQLSYSMVEARLSDHRPVIARFIAEVESSTSGRKLSTVRSRLSNDVKVSVEELLPTKSFPVTKFRSAHNNEHIAHSHSLESCRISTEPVP
jgi:phosphatidylinositol-bisphosphatase